MKELKYIEPMSVGKIYGITMALFGFLGGLFIALFSSSIGSAMYPGSGGLFQMGGIMAVVGLPVLYGVLGFLFGLLGAVVYNFVAKKFGGVRYKTDDNSPEDVL